jgi:alkanesulfonate monooxygenase SsuD/methylene tetrahydromethanopterin reductase-like flavin-dependent oxidoreductase (luciferase family)
VASSAPLLAVIEQWSVAGTPKEAVPQVRAIVDAGFQHVILVVRD